MRNVVIVDGVRTGFGKLGGSLRQFSVNQLAAMTIDGLLEKTKLLERRGGKYGLFTSCCGGGQGVTTLIENLRR